MVPILDDNNNSVEKIWPRLERTILKVIRVEKIPMDEWHGAFYDVYNVGAGSRSQAMETTNSFVNKKITQIVGKAVENIMKELMKGSDTLLENYSKSWGEWKIISSCIQNLFQSLNSTSYAGMYGSIKDNFIEVWREKIFSVLQSELFRILNETIDRDRRGVKVAAREVSNVLGSFVELEEFKLKSEKTSTNFGGNRGAISLNPMQAYEDVFETPYLHSVAEYYRKEVNKLLEMVNCSEYMKKILSMMEDENGRSRKFIHVSSWQKVFDTCHRVMVDEKCEILLASVNTFLENQYYEDLGNMYKLLKPSKNFAIFVANFESFVKNVAVQIVKALNVTEQPLKVAMKFVEDLAKFYRLYAEFIAKSAANDTPMISALDKSCSAAVNYVREGENVPNAPRYLSIYIDQFLKKSSKIADDDELERKVATAMTIFRYLEDKDIFQKYYQRNLAQRLINGDSFSTDAEGLVITKQKQLWATDFPRKAEQMFKDVQLSEDFNKNFASFIDRNNYRFFSKQFNIMICQSGSWPLSIDQLGNRNLLPEFHPFVDSCLSYYRNEQHGKKLQWLYHLSKVELSTNFLDKPYMITMFFYQAEILLLFNERDVLSRAEMEEQNLMSEDNLERYLKSCVESRLLIYSENLYRLNFEFKNPKSKFVINAQPTRNQVEKEKVKVQSDVNQDRSLFLQATIVRIMKMRKVYEHINLITEVMSQTKERFIPEPTLIKKTIETLIEKEYLKRLESDKTIYEYLP